MNPFLHPTVAQPLSADDARLSTPFKSTAAHMRAARSRAMAAREATRRLRHSARRVALAASIGMLACPAAGAPGINVNVASVQELQNIRGIGPKTAEMIVRERERSGPFESFQDFAERIRGIGPKRAKALREAGLTASSPPPGGPLPPGMR